MSLTRPANRIEYAKREVARYREDVDGWKQGHECFEQDCWVWEETFLKANFIFSLILKLDVEVQKHILIDRSSDIDLQEVLCAVLAQWLEASLKWQKHAIRLGHEYGVVEGTNELGENIRQCKQF